MMNSSETASEWPDLRAENAKLRAEAERLCEELERLESTNNTIARRAIAAELQLNELKELFELAAPMLNAYDDSLHRVRFTELHRLKEKFTEKRNNERSSS
jgi:hypothetical protein